MLYSVFMLALRPVRRNVLRSFLTLLGIVIGVSAVITMVTLGNGATQSIKTQISSLGTNLLLVLPGQRGPGGGGGGGAGVPQFTEADAEAIAAQIGGVAAVAPQGRSSATVAGNGRNWATSVTGSSNEWFETNNWKLASGRIFASDEQSTGAAVCIVGETVRREIFGGAVGSKGLGEQLRIKQFSCEIIGILAAKGQSGMGDQDDTVVVPLHTLQRRVTERTREIGLRLAVGALEGEVLLQFLIEAVVLSALGGMVGIAIATAASYGLAIVMGVPYAFDPAINLLSLLFSAAIGVVFGYFPARRAAQMDPIEALRHE